MLPAALCELAVRSIYLWMMAEFYYLEVNIFFFTCTRMDKVLHSWLDTLLAFYLFLLLRFTVFRFKKLNQILALKILAYKRGEIITVEVTFFYHSDLSFPVNYGTST